MTQSQNPDLVVGWVQKFLPDRGYGFVSPMLTTPHPIIGRDTRVFIHASAARVFAGTPEQPVITGRRVPRCWPAENVTGAFPRRADYSWLVMRVGSSPKGPEAKEWAVIPRRNTVEDVNKYGGLAAYVGMEVGVMPVNVNVPGGTWGVLEDWKLSDKQVTLTLSSARKSGDVPVVDNDGQVTRVIDYEYLRITDDTPSQLTLRLFRAEGAPTLQVVCWRRPPIN